ncbi:2-C-methyl-D-erythritol 4-phosphate cytidylyltransferase [Porticoccus sp. W117]|uniref:2-C-methyl-D-erythritol 4-phosphate cytidylyltransferase n=1 Tax=Porticoccus sp. W117 TaxID=3054777 RepID=UPI00259945F7|nr:2-C-methyl-D-erythritol 4-phosphate cytidylyltransferase [Porticoccus sp. W117]MDM3870288.1 2-C-methyl-D-erythritol 4-phosphate cytidylyltransferase [Porticoccus sp. W117]
MSNAQPKYWAVVPAAGVGRRFGGSQPKQYQNLLDKPVARWTLERLLSLPNIEQCVVALGQEDGYWPTLRLDNPRITTTIGGAERADSVRLALQALDGRAGQDDWVLVHDIARPCVRAADIANLMQQLQNHPVGGLLAAPIADTVKRVSGDHQVIATEDRRQLWSALTPQMFRYGILCKALESAGQNGTQPTDEASAIEQLGLDHKLIEGQRDNIKITRGEDLAIAAAILTAQGETK